MSSDTVGLPNKPFNEVQFIEEMSLNAWPSLQTVYYDSWLMRFSQEYTQRANSVQVIYRSAAQVDLFEKIKWCEQCYTARGQKTIFKITPAVQPESDILDQLLMARGYIQSSLTSVQTVDLTTLAVPHFQTVSLETTFSPDWLAAYCRLNQIAAHHVLTLTQMLNNIFVPHCFVALHHDHQTVAVGLAVAERGYVGLYNVVTDSAFRNRGFGKQLLLHLLNWGKAQGAHRAYLYVAADNEPALRLYEKLGFQTLYRYWYRHIKYDEGDPDSFKIRL